MKFRPMPKHVLLELKKGDEDPFVFNSIEERNNYLANQIERAREGERERKASPGRSSSKDS